MKVAVMILRNTTVLMHNIAQILYSDGATRWLHQNREWLNAPVPARECDTCMQLQGALFPPKRVPPIVMEMSEIPKVKGAPKIQK